MYFIKRRLKLTAGILLGVMTFELIYPNRALALTSGPSQPEVQGFEPVGTTDMVDLFSGDFVYNVPLIDVEGYPINISYHGGINMDQEASWVGLGWNINPGEINRSVRGIPDDFDGDSVVKIIHIRDEKNVTIGANLNTEPFGAGPPVVNLSASLGGNINLSNYKGMSVNLTGGVNANVFGFVSAGLNAGVGSQTGAGIDYNAGLQFSTSQIVSADVAAGVGLGYSSGYNTRTGLATRSFNVSANVSAGNMRIANFGANIPIGMVNNIVPVITNSSLMRSYHGQLRLGGEAFGVFGSIGVNARLSVLQYAENGSRKTYGYFNADHAGEKDILDFTREKDGFFNTSMKNLPLGSMTYDVYSVSGQGTGGSFRPFRNDFGSVYDPVMNSESRDNTYNGEAGIGNAFSFGFDINNTTTTVESGPWKEYKNAFQGSTKGSIYEPFYFKQGGELSQVNPAYYNQVGGLNPYTGLNALPTRKNGSANSRDARGNLIYYFNADEATQFGVATDTALYSYTSVNGFAGGYPGSGDKTYISRLNRNSRLGKKKHHISEIVQVQTNGKRFVYGIPAMNNVQKEVTFAVDRPGSSEDWTSGLVSYNTGSDDSKGNSKGIDNFYSATYTPSFAHSFLLSAVLSPDYIDVRGDGPTDDDLGTYTKFNYTRKEQDYRWRAPIQSGKAQHMPGFLSDTKDDKASYLIGSREQWILHSIETKNFVAEFYTSPRLDAKGVTDAIVNSGEGFDEAPYNTTAGSKGSSYKLDSIKLYNKHDRLLHTTNAIPVKTVYLTYDYSLCPYIPNKADAAPDSTGKLTLKRIFVKYGNSEKSMLSPYQFTYSSFNPRYDQANKDRWGNFKRNQTGLTNIEYPYVDQNSDSLDIYASAWSLSNIQLPSGGTINVSYEADDYAYVQNKEAAEMFLVKGVGMSNNYMPFNTLFLNENNPHFFCYFRRRNSAENRNISFSDRYFKNQSLLYYNFAVSLVPPYFEPIKGYAEIMPNGIGICPNDTNYGYVMLKPAFLQGGGIVNPVTKASLNTGRYNLSHLIFPGSNPDNSDFMNIVTGMFDAVKGLIKFMQNPNKQLMQKGKGQYVNLNKSFIRLSNPNGHKKGGGQRVRSLKFYDNWSDLVGGNAREAVYGKDYVYKSDNGSSSGVANYEPMIGGDENPLKVPIAYKVQNGSNWPPSDPIELYQEAPIGENFYPSGSVGYSKITVNSIHKEEGRSAQGQDMHEFYTARDFPFETRQSSINELVNEKKYRFKEQKSVLNVSQAYTVILNDMHGKMKRTEHRVRLPKNEKYQTISYQDYKYNTSGGRLSNEVPLISYNGYDISTWPGTLGLEVDLTIDTREKIELTKNSAFFFSSNGFMAGIFPVYIPVPVPWNGQYKNEFRSVVATKIVQQYGILSEIQSFDEGAVTTVRNDAYDPYTGQALMSSVNNEFNDKEYTLNMPAYWAYPAMGPSYQNIGYTEHFKRLEPTTGPYVITGSTFRLPTSAEHFLIGDEVLVREKAPGGKVFTAWVIDFDTSAAAYNYTKVPSSGFSGIALAPSYRYQVCISPIIQIRNAAPSYVAGLTGGVSNVDVKVIRSGRKNLLGESIQTVTAMDPLFSYSRIKTKFTGLINIKAQEYSDSLYARLERDVSPDTLNDYVNGNKGIFRLSAEYVYLSPRDYKGSGVRKAGLFDANSFWRPNRPQDHCAIVGVTESTVLPRDLDPSSPYYDPSLITRINDMFSDVTKQKPMMLTNYETDRNWKLARAITKWTPWGLEAENVDALGNYSTALYRYNHMQPVAVAQNARQKEIMNENFEDFALLYPNYIWIPYRYSVFQSEFGDLLPLGSSPYGTVNIGSSSYAEVVSSTAHSGHYSLQTKTANTAGAGASYGFVLPVVNDAHEFRMEQDKVIENKEYILSYWFRPTSTTATMTEYSLPGVTAVSPTSGSPVVKRKSNIINGWQQVEVRFRAPGIGTSSTINVRLPLYAYVDDIRIFPVDANMKSFVYDAFTQRLMATMDENNFATFYEYDQEGNLIRTKRETERGIITLSESRSANPKQ